jgi:hypothetical protein
MRDPQVHGPLTGVEFLNEDDAQEEYFEPEQGLRGLRWQTRAVAGVLVAALLLAWTVTRGSGPPPSKASPATARSTAAVPFTPPSTERGTTVPPAISRTMTRALPGIVITDSVVRVGPPPGREARSVDAHYRHLMITVDITAGRPLSATPQRFTSGASDVSVIHNRRPGARRTVTITVVAPQHAHIPIVRLQRMADELGRLPAW